MRLVQPENTADSAVIVFLAPVANIARLEVRLVLIAPLIHSPARAHHHASPVLHELQRH